MHVLHISGDYPNSPLYRQMLIGIEEAGVVKQTMYVPRQKTETSGTCVGSAPENVAVIQSKDFAVLDRALYWPKRRRVSRALSRQVSLSQIDGVHAHFLFSAGGVAELLQRKEGIPYVVSVRNTDVNLFFRRMIHLRGTGIKLLENSAAIVFLSPSYQQHVLERYVPARLRSVVAAKATVVPNGVDPYWFRNPPPAAPRRGRGDPIRLLFVGSLTGNKNAESIARAAVSLRRAGLPVHLTVVGAGPRQAAIERFAQRFPDVVTHVGWVSANHDLLGYYRSADILVLTSTHETFGLVCVEAMSQGLPVIYSEGQGIDGYFADGEIGYRVPAGHERATATAVKRIMDDDAYDDISRRALQGAQRFRWSIVARELAGIYEQHFVSRL